MAIVIGPNFYNELVAAGVDLNGITWGADGVLTYAPTVTDATKTAVATVLAAHNPATIPAATLRDQSIDAAIAGDTTIAQLKAMTATEFDTWWAANVTTAAQAITVLKRVTRLVLRKLL